MCQARTRRRLNAYIQQDGKCFYCDCIMRHPDLNSHGEIPPDDACTLEHLRDKYDPTRRELNPNKEIRRVATCYKCNHTRGVLRSISHRAERDDKCKGNSWEAQKRRWGMICASLSQPFYWALTYKLD